MATSIAAPVSPHPVSRPQLTRPTFLMCPPQWYGVDYVINPWMAGNLHGSSRDAAFAQWRGLYEGLRSVADVRLVHPEEGCPDMAFMAHGAVVHGGTAALASFSHRQRMAETAHLRRWFTEHGFMLWDTPRETAFEGEGDMVFDPSGKSLWAAHGSRTCKAAHRHVAAAWGLPVTSLHLVDPRFYHLDTCFSPLADGTLLYFAEAFDGPSQAAIEAAWAPEKRLAVTEADAIRMACSALNVGRKILTGEISYDLMADLVERGFAVERLPLGEFLKAGGGAKSLALRLSDMSTTHRQMATAA